MNGSLDQPRCPVDHSATSGASRCPVGKRGFFTEKLNPDNNMPALSSARLMGQTVDLPTDRTVSSIPKGQDDEQGNWVYPSPQQMLNAMARKSATLEGIPQDAVESMVAVHNHLNEGVWNEVQSWEQKYTDQTHKSARLLKFTGRPNDMSPRARMLQVLGKIYPSKFGFSPPFDRHDWTVLRATPDGNWKPVLYTIDFYEIPDESGIPVFSVDVRPAANSLENIKDRIVRAVGPIWNKALGRD